MSWVVAPLVGEPGYAFCYTSISEVRVPSGRRSTRIRTYMRLVYTATYMRGKRALTYAHLLLAANLEEGEDGGGRGRQQQPRRESQKLL